MRSVAHRAVKRRNICRGSASPCTRSSCARGPARRQIAAKALSLQCPTCFGVQQVELTIVFGLSEAMAHIVVCCVQLDAVAALQCADCSIDDQLLSSSCKEQ
jgi:hypothetical protein